MHLEIRGPRSEAIANMLAALHANEECAGQRGALVNAMVTLTAGIPEDHHVKIIVDLYREDDATWTAVALINSPVHPLENFAPQSPKP
jgi:hypothetical protein